MSAAKHQRTYEDFEPPAEWSEEEGCTILTIYIPGFSKEQIRVQVSSTRALRISGERAYRNTNKAWQRFHKEFQIPPNCDTSNITAKYKGGILHVRQPLLRRAAEPQQAAAETATAAEKNGKADQETSNNAGETSEDIPDRANIRNKITSRAVRLKEVIPRGLVKLILPILVVVPVLLLLMYAAMFVGVEQPPIHNESFYIENHGRHKKKNSCRHFSCILQFTKTLTSNVTICSF